MAHNSYQLNPLEYKVEEATIKKVSIESYGSKYLAIELQYESNTMQSYPAISVKDIEEVKNELFSFLDIASFDQAIGKKVFAINNFSHIFAMYNEHNNNFFCLQAKCFPEAYNQSLDKMIKDTNLSVSHLTPSEALLYSFLYCLPTKDSVSSKLHNIASSAILYKKLDSSIEHKNEINSKKLKI